MKGAAATTTARQYRNMRRTRELPVAYGLALAVLIAPAQQHDEVDKRPYSASAERHKLYDTYYGLAGIETVNTERTEEKAQQQRRKPILTALVRIRCGLLERAAAIGARLCRIRNLLSAILAINQCQNTNILTVIHPNRHPAPSANITPGMRHNGRLRKQIYAQIYYYAIQNSERTNKKISVSLVSPP